jgi:hypothetical protein
MHFAEDLIPLTVIVGVFGFVMLRVVLDYRKRRDMFQLHHAERMAAIEKGIDLPPLPAEFFVDRRGPGRFLHRGLVFTLMGIAITVALWETQSDDFRPLWGLVPIAYGLGSLLYHFIARRSRDLREPPGEPQRPP